MDSLDRLTNRAVLKAVAVAVGFLFSCLLLGGLLGYLFVRITQ